MIRKATGYRITSTLSNTSLTNSGSVFASGAPFFHLFHGFFGNFKDLFNLGYKHRQRTNRSEGRLHGVVNFDVELWPFNGFSKVECKDGKDDDAQDFYC